MAGYQKRIAYLDYLENGMRIRNAGFVKWEKNGGQIRLRVQVQNAPEQFNGQFALSAASGSAIAGIGLNRGNGTYSAVWDSGKTEEGKRWEEVYGVYIRLPGRHLIQAVWEDPMELPVDGQREDQAAEGPFAQPTDQAAEQPPAQPDDQAAEEPSAQPVDRAAEEPLAQSTDRLAEQPPAQPDDQAVEEPSAQSAGQVAEQLPAQMIAQTVGQEIAQPPEEESDREFSQRETAAEEKEPACYSDKWTQLCHMFPVIHPFRDEREYISIAPKDFVVLCREYQKMVHNSFLLHGYYNYRHLILGRTVAGQGGDKAQYFLGVPGNFYDREKMVAEMFGFEAFEGSRDPVKPGDFGYYMKKVDI